MAPVYSLKLFRERDSRLTSAAVRVVIKLIQRSSIHSDAPPPFSFEVGAKVLKRVEILRHALHKLFKLGVRLWARSKRVAALVSKLNQQRTLESQLKKTYLRYSKSSGNSRDPVGKSGPSFSLK
jgi:hypothetical protein